MSQRLLRNCISIEDLRGAAQRRLPRLVFDFIDGGARDEQIRLASKMNHPVWVFSQSKIYAYQGAMRTSPFVIDLANLKTGDLLSGYGAILVAATRGCTKRE